MRTVLLATAASALVISATAASAQVGFGPQKPGPWGAAGKGAAQSPSLADAYKPKTEPKPKAYPTVSEPKAVAPSGSMKSGDTFKPYKGYQAPKTTSVYGR